MWSTALIIIAADQLTKLWIRSTLALGESVQGPGILYITHIRNSGAAFGILQNQALPLTIASLLTAAFIVYYVFFLSHRYPILHNSLGMTTLGLVLGGIVGNLIDRIRLGYVTDFIDFRYWPAFNIADSAVSVGIVVLAFTLFFSSRKAVS